MTEITRRDVIKAQAIVAAAAAAGLPIPTAAQNLVTEAEITDLVWSKAPCRFCGTGCSIMVATKAGRVVATHGDIDRNADRQMRHVQINAERQPQAPLPRSGFVLGPIATTTGFPQDGSPLVESENSCPKGTGGYVTSGPRLCCRRNMLRSVRTRPISILKR